MSLRLINIMEKYEILTTEEIQVGVTPGVYYPKNRHYKRGDIKRNRRVVSKLGDFNIQKSTFQSNCANFKIIKNIFVKLVHEKWQWTIVHIFIVYITLWIFFAFIYWMISYCHGDLDFNHSTNSTNSHAPCIRGIHGFFSTLLFSAEVHTTLAYGRRSVTLVCPVAIAAMCLQCIFCSFFHSVMVGILLTKLTRRKPRIQSILFSNQAVIGMRDRKMCLMFRVGNVKKSRLVNIKTSAYIIRSQLDVLHINESEQIKLETEMDGCDTTFFHWPIAVMHVIDENSPLYHISAVDLLCGKLEILAVFEGIIESTGQTVQARSSYTECELLWGHRFLPMTQFDSTKESLFVDFSKLSASEEIDNPLCSACEYETYVNQELSSDILR